MDFLTQPIHHAPTSPTRTAQSPPSKPPTFPGVASSSTSDASSVLTTTTTGEQQLTATAAAFGQLRTSDGLEGEARIEAPSCKNGDVRTYGKVEARMLLWQDGTLRKGKKGSEQPKEEWVMEGTLWVTASRHIIFIVDTTQSPRRVALNRAPGSPTRRLSFFGAGSSRKSFSSPSASEQPSPETAMPSSESPVREEEGGSAGGGAMKGLVKSVKKIFQKDESEHESTEGGENKLTLTKTKTNEKALKLERTKSTSEPVLGAPFPSYKGYPISALYVADPSSILTVRYFGARAPSTPFWSPNPSAPLSSPTDLEDRPKPIGTFNVDPNSLPPCVELDVAPRGVRTARKTGGGDEGEQREVTVGFNFLETLLAKEAENFHAQVSSFMSASEGQ